MGRDERGRIVTDRGRGLAWLAMAAYFGAALILARGQDAPPVVQAAGAFGMGASLALSVVWWERGR